MNSQNISVFGNKIFSEIINEVKLFSKYKPKYFEDIDICIKETKEKNQIIIFFLTEANKVLYNKIEKIKLPVILISKNSILKHISSDQLVEKLTLPTKILDLKKKIVTLFSRTEFRKNSIINLGGYVIDKNERNIKKNNITLQLSEKEINFLSLFSDKKEPITKNAVLKSVWNYSPESETHTVETHIHRLRKKVLEKFGDNNFIKNNNKGYYI